MSDTSDLPLGGGGNGRAAAPAPDGKAAKAVAKTVAAHPFVRVVEQCLVGTGGGGAAVLRAGDEINLASYIEPGAAPLAPGQLPQRLRAAGLKVEPCDPPPWWVEAQEKAEERQRAHLIEVAEYNRRMEEDARARARR